MRFAVIFFCCIWSLPLLFANEEDEIYQAVKSQVQKLSDMAMGVVGHLKSQNSSTEKPLLNRTSSDEFIQASDFTFTKEDWEGWLLSVEMIYWMTSEIRLGRVEPSKEQLKRKFGKTSIEIKYAALPVALAMCVARVSDKKSNLGFSKEVLDLDIYLIDSHPVFGQEEIKHYKIGQLIWLEQLFTKEMFLELERYGATPPSAIQRGNFIGYKYDRPVEIGYPPYRHEIYFEVKGNKAYFKDLLVDGSSIVGSSSQMERQLLQNAFRHVGMGEAADALSNPIKAKLLKVLENLKNVDFPIEWDRDRVYLEVRMPDWVRKKRSELRQKYQIEEDVPRVVPTKGE